MSFEIRILSATTLWEKLYTYLYENFIDTQGSYENLNFNGFISFQTVILGLYIVMAIMAVILFVSKNSYAILVKRLVEKDALSSEKGRTLPELDLADKLLLRYGLKRSSALRRVVLCREEEEYYGEIDQMALQYEEMRKENPKLPKRFSPKPFKLSPDAHHFYIPEEDRYKAEVRYEYKPNYTLKLAALSVALVIGLVLLLIFLPNIMELLNEWVGTLITKA